MRIRWALCKKEDVARSRARLERHSSPVNMLLITLQLYEAMFADFRNMETASLISKQERGVSLLTQAARVPPKHSQHAEHGRQHQQ